MPLGNLVHEFFLFTDFGTYRAAAVPCAVAVILLHIPLCYGLYIVLKRRREKKVSAAALKTSFASSDV